MADAAPTGEDFWSATIAAFQPLITSPAITEKLLQRPPFRFIHDIVSSIDSRFQAYNHLFTEEELDAGRLDNKEKKIVYLEKIISFLALILGRPVDVSSKKIVAGQEPERSNAFLRDLALGVGYAQQYKQQLASAAAVAAAAPPPPPPPPPSSEPPPPPPPSSSGGEKPKLTVKTNIVVCPNKDILLKEATDFVARLQGLGIALAPPQSTSGEVSVGESIRSMERELKSKELPQTDPGKLTAASLEIAIQRQLESINQIKMLIDENSQICGNLIDATMSTF